jgi:hypothetical protein
VSPEEGSTLRYLDFHPHLHALVADGLFVQSGLFHVMPEVSLKPLEKLFQAKLIAFLVKKTLLPPERARMLQSWKHSGFNVHRSRRVQPDEREDLERLARYIIRNPFSIEKMEVSQPGGPIIYRSGMNEKIHRNFEVFSPCDFIAAITQHIPDKSFQLVRYYGWYSNKMRGQRNKQAAAEAKAGAVHAAEVIDVSEHKPRRIPSAKWRELIKKVWEADPLQCPRCSCEMRIEIPIRIRDGVVPLWKKHPDVDVAGIFVRLPTNTVRTLLTTSELISDKQLTEYEIYPGMELMCLGYPFGAEANALGFPILRSGRIASYPLTPTKTTKTFLFDFTVFRGNSGGPVYFVEKDPAYGGMRRMGTAIYGIIGIVIEERNITERIEDLYEKREKTTPLQIGNVVHASFVKELVDSMGFPK